MPEDMVKKFTTDELFELFGGCIPWEFFHLTNDDTKDNTKTPVEIREAVIKLADEWRLSGSPQVEYLKGEITNAVQSRGLALFDIGGWFKILEYHDFLKARNTENGRVALSPTIGFILDEMTNLIILDMVNKKVVASAMDFNNRGITIDHIRRAIAFFKVAEENCFQA